MLLAASKALLLLALVGTAPATLAARALAAAVDGGAPEAETAPGKVLPATRWRPAMLLPPPPPPLLPSSTTLPSRTPLLCRTEPRHAAVIGGS